MTALDSSVISLRRREREKEIGKKRVQRKDNGVFRCILLIGYSRKYNWQVDRRYNRNIYVQLCTTLTLILLVAEGAVLRGFALQHVF